LLADVDVAINRFFITLYVEEAGQRTEVAPQICTAL